LPAGSAIRVNFPPLSGAWWELRRGNIGGRYSKGEVFHADGVIASMFLRDARADNAANGE